MCVAKMGNIREFSDNVVSTISLQCDSGKLVVWVVSLARLFKVLKSELQFQETVGEKNFKCIFEILKTLIYFSGFAKSCHLSSFFTHLSVSQDQDTNL